MKNAKIVIMSAYENETTQTTLFGKAWTENCVQYIQYDEINQTEIGNFKTLIFYQNNVLTIRREGDVQMDMVFDVNNESQFPVSTKYGDFFAILHTKTLKIDEMESGTDIEIIYDLIFDESEAYAHEIKIHYSYIDLFFGENYFE